MLDKTKNYVPKRCLFEVTLKCNLRCNHCGSRAGRARDDELTTSEAADLFRQLADLGCERITLSGGEPLTRKDWPQLVEDARATGMRVAMVSNGMRLGPEQARTAKEAGLHVIGLSIDGTKRNHDLVRGRIGHYEMVMDAMSAAAEAGLPFAGITHINRRNMNELPAIGQIVRDAGAFAWQVQPATAMGNMRDNDGLQLRPRDLIGLEKILAQIVERKDLRTVVADSFGYFGPHEKAIRTEHPGGCFGGCSAGIRNVGIESNGNVKGCMAIMAGYNDEGADFVEGNIREQSLAEIWNRPGAFSYRREWSIDDLGGFCRECRHAAGCKGGCHSNLVANGDGHENTHCVYRALVIEAQNQPKSGSRVAAMALVGLLGASAQGCWVSQEVLRDSDGMDAGDTGSDTQFDTDTGDVPPYDAPLYDVPETDIDSESDTGNVDPYSVPDTDSESETGADMYAVPEE